MSWFCLNLGLDLPWADNLDSGGYITSTHVAATMLRAQFVRRRIFGRSGVLIFWHFTTFQMIGGSTPAILITACRDRLYVMACHFHLRDEFARHPVMVPQIEWLIDDR
jgi:hypothetical protein